MRLQEFERRAAEVWEEIPASYRAGVDGLVIRKERRAHPSLPDIYTLGECLTESYPSEWGGPDTTRSVLVLYHGSFVALSRLDDAFDWEYELWETITHELRHHLESLAADATLEDVDYAMDENFKRFEGEPFDPFFFRSGERVGPGVYQVEDDVFLEQEMPAARPSDGRIEFLWRRRPYTVPLPEDPGDVTFLQVVAGLEAPGREAGTPQVCVVLVRRTGWLASLRSWLRRESPAVVDEDVEAAPVAGPEDADAG